VWTAADVGMVGGAVALARAKSLIYKGTLGPAEAKVIFAGAEKWLIGLSDFGEASWIIEELYERLVKTEDLVRPTRFVFCALLHQ